MAQVEHTSTEENNQQTSRSGPVTKLGIVLIIVGVILLADFNLKTGWLALSIVPGLGLFFLFASFYFHKPGWMVPGILTLGIGAGSFFAFSPVFHFRTVEKVGYALLAFGLSWLVIGILSHFHYERVFWWAMIPAGVIGMTGYVFAFTSVRWDDFILYVPLGLGVAFLAWGLVERLFGLIIPGCLLVSTGPGIFAAGWDGSAQSNGLTQTGIMLVCFALGWGLITLCSWRVTHKFVWWPLIPGGVLAMVGWGLYIGGNPGNAVEFIGNTGSIGLILFGLYLLLLRRGIHH